MEKSLLSIERLTISYEHPTVRDSVILDSACCSLLRNNIHFLVGANGSGKTSLFRALLGLQNESQKFIRLEGSDKLISGRDLARTIKLGYIPQFPHEALVPTLSIVENLYLRSLLLGVRAYNSFGQWFSKATAKSSLVAFENALSSFGKAAKILKGRQYDPYHSFSGGELQILNLAAMFTLDVDLLVMDEPTGKLDQDNRMVFWNTLAELVDNKPLTILSTTHEESFMKSSIMRQSFSLLKIEGKKIVPV